jgi:hypothetical protein
MVGTGGVAEAPFAVVGRASVAMAGNLYELDRIKRIFGINRIRAASRRVGAQVVILPILLILSIP